jgi:hypothetical protein
MSWTLAFRISVALVTLWAVAALTLWFYEPMKALPTLLAVLFSVAALSFAARDGAPAEKSMNGIVTDWQDREPTAGELRLRNEAVRRCRGSGEREGVQVGGSEGVAYRDRDRIVWAINRPHAIARGWATLAE